jgi:ABC-type branched-subunit amino acid transport system ATPase component/branched-subunit amino acid ABC-type transport system permease component
MSPYLPFLISGLVIGSVYGLAGTGLVLTYKTSGVFNFAHGAIATISAYVFYELNVKHGWSWPLAALACVAVVGPVLGLAFERVARTLTGASLATKVASTIGVLLIVQAVIALTVDSAQTLIVPQFLPTHAFHVDGTQVTVAQLIVVGIALVATVGLYAFFRVTRLGVTMRAVVDDPDLLDLAGTSPARVRRAAWMIGVSFASASGVLLAPLLAQLNALNLTFLIVTAFGAAAIGAFTSIPLTYFGGLAIGVAQQLCTKQFSTGFFTGLSPGLPFIALFVVLLVLPRRKLVERSRIVARQKAFAVPARVQAVGGVALIGFLIYVPYSSFIGFHIDDWISGLAYLVLFMSLGLLVRTSGQVSLAHVSFMAIGACAMSHLAVGHHVPWAVALFVSGLIALPIGAVLSIPAIRLSGLYLALATFGFGILLQYMFYSEDFMFGSNAAALTVPRPHLSWLAIDSDKGYYYLVLGLAVLTTLFLVTVNRSRLGRLLRALADSPTGLSTSGTSVNVTRVLVFCMSAFLAAVAGALQGGATQQVSSDAYIPIESLIFFALIVICVGGEPWYAVMAAGLLIIGPTLGSLGNTPKAQNWFTLCFGLVALLYPLLASLPERLGLRRQRQPVHARHSAPADAAAAARRPPVPAGDLRVEAVRVAFGGLVAVDDVSLDVPTGRITGLIGPNGAGKTTTFNACSGLVQPSAGTITLDGSSLTNRGPSARARRGLGRTFQQMELFDSLTVHSNVALGMEGGLAGPNALSHLVSTPAQKVAVRTAADEAMTLCGITDLADRVVADLSTGQRRLVELARCLAGPFRVLLLDEPSSGLDGVETERFGEILKQVVAERGVGILLVEHDMSLVTAICDYIYVLDFGAPIFEGEPAAVMASSIVKSAYLGDDAVEEAVTSR